MLEHAAGLDFHPRPFCSFDGFIRTFEFQAVRKSRRRRDFRFSSLIALTISGAKLKPARKSRMHAFDVCRVDRLRPSLRLFSDKNLAAMPRPDCGPPCRCRKFYIGFVFRYSVRIETIRLALSHFASATQIILTFGRPTGRRSSRHTVSSLRRLYGLKLTETCEYPCREPQKRIDDVRADCANGAGRPRLRHTTVPGRFGPAMERGIYCRWRTRPLSPA